MEVYDIRQGSHTELGRFRAPVSRASALGHGTGAARGHLGSEFLVPRDASGNGRGSAVRSHAPVSQYQACSRTLPLAARDRQCRKRTDIGTVKGAAAGCLCRSLPVPYQHEEDLMNRTLTELDREWTQLCASAASLAAVSAWGAREPALTGFDSLGAVLRTRKQEPGTAPAILSALAHLAADDQLAARTLLQAMLPGLVAMAATSCSDDPAAMEELVSLAWERIRTYPTRRPGSVAANVLMDVRKRYREHRSIDAPVHEIVELPAAGVEPSAEEVVLGRSVVHDLVAARRSGLIGSVGLALILRTRIDGIPLELAAGEQRASVKQASCIRWRAERRLRPVLPRVS